MGNCCLEPTVDRQHEQVGYPGYQQGGYSGGNNGYQPVDSRYQQPPGYQTQPTPHRSGFELGPQPSNPNYPSAPAPARNAASRPFSLAELLNVLNDVRGNPQKYAGVVQRKYIDDLDSRGVLRSKGIQTQEGLAVFKEAKTFLERARPLPPLTLDCGLTAAAYLHSCFMSETNNLDHTGRGGSDVAARIDKFGRVDQYGTVGNAENILYTYDYDAEDFILNFVVDDGVPNRGHRDNIFHPSLYKVGLGVKDPSRNSSGQWYFTMDFAYETYKGQKSMIPANVMEESGLNDYSRATGITF